MGSLAVATAAAGVLLPGPVADLVRDAVGLDVVPAALRDAPTPGTEEQDAPLGTPPSVADPSPQHAFIEEQRLPDGTTAPVGWSPCRPIHYVVDPANAPENFPDVVALEVARLSELTGLQFVADGLVDESLDAVARDPYQPDRYGDRWAPVLVTFADIPSEVPDHADAQGLAAPQPARDPSTGLLHYVSGTVVLDLSLLAVPGTVEGMPPWVPTLRHELAHLVGLDHVEDRTQLMGTSGRLVTDYAAGDRTGLARLGAGPCAPGL